MAQKLSKRLSEIADALPLRSGLQLVEIGCGSGALLRAIAARVDEAKLLGIDRSKAAVDAAMELSAAEIETGCIEYIQSAIETFTVPATLQRRFDIALAVRVGALDGRHPKLEKAALSAIRQLLKKNGKLLIDGGDPLREIHLR